jgi:hypothetical protein
MSRLTDAAEKACDALFTVEQCDTLEGDERDAVILVSNLCQDIRDGHR